MMVGSSMGGLMVVGGSMGGLMVVGGSMGGAGAENAGARSGDSRFITPREAAADDFLAGTALLFDRAVGDIAVGNAVSGGLAVVFDW
jgi:hypothetical protein